MASFFNIVIALLTIAITLERAIKKRSKDAKNEYRAITLQGAIEKS